MQTALYDTIGKTYDHTRKADAHIVDLILQYLSPDKHGLYLDVGCGSGNYTHALAERELNICGVDISQEMLAKARRKNPNLSWTLGDAKQLPFIDRFFDGAVCILATHHIQDIEKAFQEIFRVMKAGNFVIFTAFPEQMENYWLKEYFPLMMKKANQKMADLKRFSTALLDAGFQNIQVEKFSISNELQDWFLHAGKYRPEIYLDASVRAGISTFAIEENREEVVDGCEHMRQDIESGQIKQVIQSYESELGDYAFVTCSKNLKGR
jgi:ubiquinone/menaquinone biosynthesis C-methylase UbiE